jgi:hypothetical protein
MAKHANLVEAKDLKVGDVVTSSTIDGPRHRTIVLIRHSEGSSRYAFNLDDNDYFTLEEGDHATTITED